nr:PREDICTED: rab GTPase-activating protein 1-like isoform X1 [Bemisia tabaci]
MDDTVSELSGESIPSDDYEFINDPLQRQNLLYPLPYLKIADNGDLNQLKTCLNEVLNESETMSDSDQKDCSEGSKLKENPISPKDDYMPSDVAISEIADDDYWATLAENSFSDNGGDIIQDCTMFNGITYLGAAAINAPKSEPEILRNMAILNNEQSADTAIKVSLSIPSYSTGTVVIYDAATNVVMGKYEIPRISFYARGTSDTKEAACFAFTWSHGDTLESAIFQCHVFKCDIPEAVGQVSLCFAKAFEKPKSMTLSLNGDLSQSEQYEFGSKASNVKMFVFEVLLEIKEDDGKGGFALVPREKSYLKLRSNVAKQICLTVKQVMSNDADAHSLQVERCFGVLVSPGRHVRHSDMQLLDIFSMGLRSENGCTSYIISGHWDPTNPVFESLNVESQKNYLTIAVDLVMDCISEPVRFSLVTPVKIFPQNEKFWSFIWRPVIQQFYLHLQQVPNTENLEYKLVSIECSGELDRNRLNLTFNKLANFIRSPSLSSVEALSPRDDSSDGDEPLLSGTGEVSKDCPEDELSSWADVLARWRANNAKPRQLNSLVKQGIPEALRGEVWQRLAQSENDDATMDTYRILITQESSCESVIQRDINRTFPANDFFKEAGGMGQDSLYRISKAYAVHDSEVGYCQGLSFLAATLLLHMPEEQAFCVLVKLMYDYGLRDLYKDGFENLYLRLYQLNRLIEEQIPALWSHLKEKGVETHMFASQWFLTLYTARFPLYFVFRVIDLFLFQGLDTLFQIALALLMMIKKDLLALDFENILKYFRVSLPKKCRNEETAGLLIKYACSIKVKKLKKYQQEFLALKEAQDSADNYGTELDQLRSSLLRTEEEKSRLEYELVQIKRMLQKEVEKAENDNNRNKTIIAEYKQICQRLDLEQSNAKQSLNQLKSKIADCTSCRTHVSDSMSVLNGCEKVESIEVDTTEAEKNQLAQRISELELQLAQAKLAQVEAECRNQDLTHQLNTALAELQTAQNSWLHKTFTSIKEVAANKTVIQKKEPVQSDSLTK